MLMLLMLTQLAELDTQQRGDAVARLAVRVADRPLSPGRAQVRYVVTVEGPPSLHLEAPRLEDAFAAWKVSHQSSSWSVAERTHVEWVLDLEQTKPGVVPLPGLRLRLRDGVAAPWEEVNWPDPLHTARDVVPVVEIAPAVPSPWVGALQAASLLLAATVGVLLLVRRMRRTKSRSRAPMSPAERAEAFLLACPDAAAISAVVRDYLEVTTGVQATRLTTAEILGILSGCQNLEALRHLLHQGDLAKFAGTPADAAQCRQLAAEVIRSAQTWTVGEMSPSGEVR